MGLNAVEVDEAALAAEADRVLSDVPAELASAGDPAPANAGDSPAPAGELTLEQLQTIAAGYEAGSFLIISKVADLVVPAWEISSDERKELSGAMSLAMAAWFPDYQLPPQWMALLSVAGSMYSIVDARRDPKTGKLKPRRNAPTEQPSAAGAASAATAAA